MTKASYLIWKDEYSVGVEKLDAQHKMIFEAINGLYDAIQEENQSYAITKVMEMLSKYIKTHFTDEELFMRKNIFPEYSAHKKMHEKLTVKTEYIIEQFRKTREDMSLELLKLMKSWWKNHILLSDQKYRQN